MLRNRRLRLEVAGHDHFQLQGGEDPAPETEDVVIQMVKGVEATVQNWRKSNNWTPLTGREKNMRHDQRGLYHPDVLVIQNLLRLYVARNLQCGHPNVTAPQEPLQVCMARNLHFHDAVVPNPRLLAGGGRDRCLGRARKTQSHLVG